MKRTYIEWDDSEAEGSWELPENIKYPARPIQTIGYIIKENAKYIIISHSHDPNHDTFCGYMTIPKCSIKKRQDSPE